jgi:hypothetical protein
LHAAKHSAERNDYDCRPIVLVRGSGKSSKQTAKPSMRASNHRVS